MKMIYILILTVSVFMYLDANVILTIESYQVEVFNTKTKYTVDLRETNGQAVYINKSDSVTFSCTATGTSFYVALLRNGHEIERECSKYGETGKVPLTYTQRDMSCSDAAKFTCRAANKQELSNFTQVIIVKCPDPPPVKFISSNVNKVQYTSLQFHCEKHKDVKPNDKFLVSIQSMNGTILNSTNSSSATQFYFSYLTCEDMGTYSCQTMTGTFNHTKITDLNVQLCPPIIPNHMETLNAVIGKPLNLTLHTTQLESTTTTVFYYNLTVTSNQCNAKFCFLEKTESSKWRREMTISFKNITEEDFGHQMLRLCTQPLDTYICTNMTLVIRQKSLFQTEINTEFIDTNNYTSVIVNNDEPRVGKSTGESGGNSNWILPIVLACSGVVVLAIVLLAVMLKVKGKHLMKKLNGRSDEHNKDRNRAGNVQENGLSANVHLPGNTTHTTTVTDNGQTVTLENLTYTTLGNTQVIKKTERTIIEEVKETVEIVNFLNEPEVDEVAQNQRNAEANLQNHTYYNIDLTPA